MAEPGWKIERFDRKRHDRSQFDCGIDGLNHWLRTKVSQYERRDLTRAYVLVREGEDVVEGFYTLSCHSITYETLTDDAAKGLPQIDIPLVLVGKLAIDRRSQRRGLGERLMYDALRRAEYLAHNIGVQAVEVTAINESAKRFYEDFGFHVLKDDPYHLLLPMRVIRSLKLSPL